MNRNHVDMFGCQCDACRAADAQSRDADIPLASVRSPWSSGRVDNHHEHEGDDMINGLHFDMTSTELREALKAKMERNAAKAKEYLEIAEKFGSSSAVSGPVNRTGMQDAKGRAANYERVANLAKFQMNHVPDGETYRLSPHELNDIGVIDGDIEYDDF